MLIKDYTYNERYDVIIIKNAIILTPLDPECNIIYFAKEVKERFIINNDLDFKIYICLFAINGMDEKDSIVVYNMKDEKFSSFVPTAENKQEYHYVLNCIYKTMNSNNLYEKIWANNFNISDEEFEELFHTNKKIVKGEVNYEK